MKADRRKGLESIKTIRAQVNKFKTRTPQGTLIELARLEIEKKRLREEMERLEKRSKRIETRLREIADMETCLYKLVENPDASPESEPKERVSNIPRELNGIIIRY
jgi:hypothetical protein